MRGLLSSGCASLQNGGFCRNKFPFAGYRWQKLPGAVAEIAGFHEESPKAEG
jgi:hypothetical protein